MCADILKLKMSATVLKVWCSLPKWKASHRFIYHDKKKINLACIMILRGKKKSIWYITMQQESWFGRVFIGVHWFQVFLWEMFLIKTAIWDLSHIFCPLELFLREHALKLDIRYNHNFFLCHFRLRFALGFVLPNTDCQASERKMFL